MKRNHACFKLTFDLNSNPVKYDVTAQGPPAKLHSSRIFNSVGDFAYVIDNTFKIKMTKKQPVKEFLYQGGAYVEVANEQQPTVDLIFVRGDGNKTLYEQRR